MSLIQSKLQAENWLAKRLGQEGLGFWTDREREELAAKLAQDYLKFLEKESGAKIGMVSTGPDREQTMTLPEFDAALKG